MGLRIENNMRLHDRVVISTIQAVPADCSGWRKATENQIAARAGVSSRTVHRVIKDYMALGLIERIGGAGRNACSYRFLQDVQIDGLR